jgi:hypothetical protein
VNDGWRSVETGHAAKILTPKDWSRPTSPAATDQPAT